MTQATPLLGKIYLSAHISVYMYARLVKTTLRFAAGVRRKSARICGSAAVLVFSATAGPDLRGGGRGPGPQAPHQQGALHQTLHILFLVQLTLI